MFEVCIVSRSLNFDEKSISRQKGKVYLAEIVVILFKGSFTA